MTNWKEINLGDAATFVNGYPFKPSDWSIKGDEIIRIQNLTKSSKEANYFEGEIAEKYKVRKGDLLISWSATLGIYEWEGEDAWLNQHIFKVVFNKKEFDKNFFKYLISYLLDELGQEVHGATMKHITKKKFDAVQIPLPPLATQKKIAAILDAADAHRQKTKQLLAKYDELAQSIFLEMFGDPLTNPKGWEVKRFGDYISYLADIGSNGANKLVSEKLEMSDNEDYALMIRTTNLSRNDFKNNVKFVSKEVYDFFRKSQVFGGEMIMNKIGSAGDFWIMPNLNRPVSLGLNQFLIRITNIELKYVYYFLSSDFGKRQIKSKLNGATTKSITKSAVKDLPLLAPPNKIQLQFSESVKLIESQKEKVEVGLKESENLFNSLLQKAFKGELNV
jgi:type I restriction enzyme, S subunit